MIERRYQYTLESLNDLVYPTKENTEIFTDSFELQFYQPTGPGIPDVRTQIST